MLEGSCACGEYTYEVPDGTQGTLLCHCLPCRKFAGSNGSTNGIVPKDEYKQLSGNLKSWTRKGDSGKDLTNNYCENCSTLMWVRADAMPDVTIVKVGTLDDKAVLDKMTPFQEIYTKRKPDCILAYQGAAQTEEGL